MVSSTAGSHGLGLATYLQLLLGFSEGLVRRSQIALVHVATLNETDETFFIKSGPERENAPRTLSVLPSKLFSLAPFALSMAEVCPFKLGWSEGY